MIPEITDPMGKCWGQPKLSAIKFNHLTDKDKGLEIDEFVSMDPESFEKLMDYSTSIPTGKYAGKMWKRQTPQGWHLCWYSKSNDPKFLDINSWRIVLNGI